jgi:hypothetical protein
VKLPIARVTRPSTLNGLTNGELPDEVLTVIGPKGELESTAARAWFALYAAAKSAGHELTYTYGGTFRSYDDQESLFRRRYTDRYDPAVNTTTGVRHWQGRKWWKRQKVAAAAVPGTSNHGWGLAVDAAVGDHPRNASPITSALPWLIENAARFGFSWELQSEPWHIRYVAGDAVPAAVLAHESPAPEVQIVEGDEFEMKIVDPVRVFDSRHHGGAFAEGETRRIKVADAAAVFVNVTVVPRAPGFATVWGAGTRPDVSNVNFEGTPICNTSWVPVDRGHINVFVSAAADVIVDLQATS